MPPLYPKRVKAWRMFLFFSNQLGCLPSLALSAAVTLILLVATGIVEL